jgi:ribosome assembly protein 4
MNGRIQIWDPKTGEPTSKVTMSGHRKWVTSIVWEPHHLNANCDRFATSSKDHTVKIWNASTRKKVSTIFLILKTVCIFILLTMYFLL